MKRLHGFLLAVAGCIVIAVVVELLGVPQPYGSFVSGMLAGLWTLALLWKVK